ncbi:hypothetical protein [Streptomyces sp. enrichment culture]|uniref:hypothetical protein n=1 Tax=Streptomyces sp. enrichment culture TaxID=1795815 RepID=UPI003F56CFA1
MSARPPRPGGALGGVLIALRVGSAPRSAVPGLEERDFTTALVGCCRLLPAPAVAVDAAQGTGGRDQQSRRQVRPRQRGAGGRAGGDGHRGGRAAPSTAVPVPRPGPTS